MTELACPKTGAPMHRDRRPMTLTYKGESLSFEMPGWYCDVSDESIHTGADLKFSDRMLNRLKARTEGLLEPEAIRRIRGRGHNHLACFLRATGAGCTLARTWRQAWLRRRRS
jgi:HTH-type transcriptional regulator/antitoxin MqsA